MNTQHTLKLKKSKKCPCNASRPGAMINTHKLELALSQTYFHGSSTVLAHMQKQRLLMSYPLCLHTHFCMYVNYHKSPF